MAKITKPTDIPSIEKRGEDKYFCSMCCSFFDREGFEVNEKACPGCERMRKQQERQPYPGAL